MKTGDFARPKGTSRPFQPIVKEEDGYFAIHWNMQKGWSHTAWYEERELEVAK